GSCAAVVVPSAIRLPSSSHRSADDRHLHSFPTRRSSDLCNALKRSVAIRTCKTLWMPLFCKGIDASISDGLITSSASSRVHSVEDRKSTRLNSSHVKISYAVFCLKKKTDNRRLAAD